MLGGLSLLTAVTPAWLIFVHTVDGLPDGARLWLPTYLIWFVGGMLLAVLAAMGVRCYAFAVLPVAVASYFIASTPIAGEPATSPYALGARGVEGGLLRRDRDAGRRAGGAG